MNIIFLSISGSEKIWDVRFDFIISRLLIYSFINVIYAWIDNDFFIAMLMYMFETQYEAIPYL